MSSVARLPTAAVLSQVLRRVWLLLMLVPVPFFMAGCTPDGSNLPPLTDSPVAGYHLGPGDQLRVTTFGSDDLSGNFRVSDTGQLELPLVGSFPAAGMTPSAVADEIAAALKDKKVLNDPHVSVEVLSYRPVFVLGEVSKPGQYPYQPGMTLLTAVAVAGGFTYRAVEDTASVTRTVNGKATEYKATRQGVLQPGDVVTVFERHF